MSVRSKFRKARHAVIIGRASRFGPPAFKEWRPFDATPFSDARADQKEQP